MMTQIDQMDCAQRRTTNSSAMPQTRGGNAHGVQIKECNVCWNAENLKKSHGGTDVATSTRLDSIKSYMEDDGIYSHMKSVIEHNMKVVMQLAQKIFCVAHGQLLAEGGPDEIKNDKRVVDAYLGAQ